MLPMFLDSECYISFICIFDIFFIISYLIELKGNNNL